MLVILLKWFWRKNTVIHPYSRICCLRCSSQQDVTWVIFQIFNIVRFHELLASSQHRTPYDASQSAPLILCIFRSSLLSQRNMTVSGNESVVRGEKAHTQFSKKTYIYLIRHLPMNLSLVNTRRCVYADRKYAFPVGFRTSFITYYSRTEHSVSETGFVSFLRWKRRKAHNRSSSLAAVYLSHWPWEH
jgi:hypothetical protein